MAFKIIWSEPALGDLASLTGFIAEDNPIAAEKTGAAILTKVVHLTRYPRLGRVVPEIGKETVRELIHRPYRIIYHINSKSKSIEILRVWHGARGQPEI